MTATLWNARRLNYDALAGKLLRGNGGYFHFECESIMGFAKTGDEVQRVLHRLAHAVTEQFTVPVLPAWSLPVTL
jgi:hypothetical protein